MLKIKIYSYPKKVFMTFRFGEEKWVYLIKERNLGKAISQHMVLEMNCGKLIKYHITLQKIWGIRKSNLFEVFRSKRQYEGIKWNFQWYLLTEKLKIVNKINDIFENCIIIDANRCRLNE